MYNKAADTTAQTVQSVRDTAIQKKANQAYEYAGQTYQAAKDTVTDYTNTTLRKTGEAWEGTVTPPTEAADAGGDAKGTGGDWKETSKEHVFKADLPTGLSRGRFRTDGRTDGRTIGRWPWGRP
jgi:hypothetical protein